MSPPIKFDLDYSDSENASVIDLFSIAKVLFSSWKYAFYDRYTNLRMIYIV